MIEHSFSSASCINIHQVAAVGLGSIAICCTKGLGFGMIKVIM